MIDEARTPDASDEVPTPLRIPVDRRDELLRRLNEAFARALAEIEEEEPRAA